VNPLEGIDSVATAVKVNYFAVGEIMSNSLWPVASPDVLVHTVYRQDMWVKRLLTNYERLLAYDVPEQVIKMFSDDRHRKLLIDSLPMPVKVIQICVEHVAQLLREGNAPPTSNTKRDRCNEEECDRSKRLRLESYKNHEDLRNNGTVVEWVTDTKHETVSDQPSPIIQADHNLAATKKDSALVPVGLWDKYLNLLVPGVTDHPSFQRVAKWLRDRLLRMWKRKVTKSFFEWEHAHASGMRSEEQWTHNRLAARECIQKTSNASWWTWDQGSRPLFWRWPIDYQSVVRDGVKVWFRGPGVFYKTKQKNPGSGEIIEMVSKKLETIRNKGYIEEGQIVSLMPFFHVPKGEEDVRMVYDGSKSGLNDCLWAPWFPLPTVDCLVRALQPGYSMADNDVGEMFHNFMLHQDLRKYCGLDLSLYFQKPNVNSKVNKGRLWERWNRLAMGLRPSPYCAIQGMMMAKEVILGDQYDRISNVFHWETMRLNLPGDLTYTPSEAWATKVRYDGTVAADVFVYVDDIRSCAPTELEAWKASQRTSAVLGYLGLQDASRKRREPGLETGAWTGSVVWSSNNKLVVLTTQEKWDKTRAHLNWIANHIGDKTGMENKKLKSIRGFLVYVARTYTSMVPYLKGIHATIDSWRKNRNIDGWKYPGLRDQWQDDFQFLDIDHKLGLDDLEIEEPLFVFPVPRLKTDLHSLLELTNHEHPPHRLVRMKSTAKVVYGFGDASKQGFGATITTPDNSIHWTSGHWDLDAEQRSQQKHVIGPLIIQERSSNYRELRNLVQELEKAFDRGLLNEREVFMFTDNSTAEAAYFKGTSSSELLFGLILRIRKLEMSGQCKIHMIHVAGTRMIWQGTDGLSRGDRNAGVMAGISMLDFVPLNRTALHRNPALKEWIGSWTGEEVQKLSSLIFLNPDDWPKSLRSEAIYVWSPPPAVADVAAKYMAQAIHKRTTSTHIFLCPRLMTAKWFRMIIKATDVVFRIPANNDIWDASQHEPLIVAIFFPLRSQYPWKRKGDGTFEHEAKSVQGLLSSDFSRAGIVLREFFLRSKFVGTM
jgi:hypothetical protein